MLFLFEAKIALKSCNTAKSVVFFRLLYFWVLTILYFINDKFTQKNSQITKGLADWRAWYFLTPHPFGGTTHSLKYN